MQHQRSFCSFRIALIFRWDYFQPPFFPLPSSLIPRLSDILPQRATTLSDGCLFRLGKGNWVRRLGDNGAFVAENCLCDRNADIIQIRTFMKRRQSSNFVIINRGSISRCIHPFSLSSPTLFMFTWPLFQYRSISCPVYQEWMTHSGPQTALLPFFPLPCHALLMSFSLTQLLVQGLEVINLMKEHQQPSQCLFTPQLLPFTWPLPPDLLIRFTHF